MSAFQGMRGDGDWVDDQMPENWRETILYEYPNGDSPITAIMSMMSSESTDSPIFHWWEKRLPAQSGAVSSIYIDVGLGTEYVYATHQSTFGIDGAIVYAKVAEALAQEVRKGHKVTLKDASRYDVDVNGRVVGVNYNGSSSYIAIKLLEDDDNSNDSSSYNLATVDRLMITGNSNPEGGAIPRGVAYDPTPYENLTGIYRTPLEMTRTAKKTRLRTGDQVEQAKAEALELHGIEREKDLIWGVKKAGTGENNKPERTPWGIIPFVRNYATTIAATGESSIQDFRYSANYSGQTWLDGGEDWLDDMLEYLGIYAPDEVIGLSGNAAVTGLTKLGKYTGNINMEPGPNNSYGMRFRTWVNAHITIHLKKHPLLARESSTRRMMILFAAKNLKDRILDDTDYLPDRQANGIDGEVSEFLGEMGPEIHFPDQFMILDGIGADNLV